MALAIVWRNSAAEWAGNGTSVEWEVPNPYLTMEPSIRWHSNVSWHLRQVTQNMNVLFNLESATSTELFFGVKDNVPLRLAKDSWKSPKLMIPNAVFVIKSVARP